MRLEDSRWLHILVVDSRCQRAETSTLELYIFQKNQQWMTIIVFLFSKWKKHLVNILLSLVTITKAFSLQVFTKSFLCYRQHRPSKNYKPPFEDGRECVWSRLYLRLFAFIRFKSWPLAKLKEWWEQVTEALCVSFRYFFPFLFVFLFLLGFFFSFFPVMHERHRQGNGEHTSHIYDYFIFISWLHTISVFSSFLSLFARQTIIDDSTHSAY